MFFAIKVNPDYEDVLENLKLSRFDVIGCLKSHGKQYLKTKPYVMCASFASNDYLAWYSDVEDLSKVFNIFSKYTTFEPSVLVYSDPPELKETFNYEAIGLQSNVSDANKNSFLVLDFKD